MATTYTPNADDLTHPVGSDPVKVGASEIQLLKNKVKTLADAITSMASGGTPFTYPIVTSGISDGAVTAAKLAADTLALFPGKFGSFPFWEEKSIDGLHVIWFVDTIGNLVGMGTNEVGSLGDGSDTSNTPRYRYVRAIFNVALPVGVTVKELHLTQGTTLVLFSNGWIYGCGANAQGQLGVGDTTTRNVFTRIEFFVTNVITPSTLLMHGDGTDNTAASVFALDATGKVYTWGGNANGQLGQGDTTNRNTPTLIATGLPGGYVATKIYGYAGRLGCLFVILNTNAVYACGFNGFGQLGFNDTTQRTTLAVLSTLPPAGTIARIIACVGYNSVPSGSVNIFMLTTTGDVWSAGANAVGQLGQGDTANRSVFTKIAALSNIANVIIADNPNTNSLYALETVAAGGRIWAWGFNSQGQLGQGNTTNLSTPTLITQYSGGASAPWNAIVKQVIPVGTQYTPTNAIGVIILTTTGLLYSAGGDTYYALGQNAAATTNKLTPLNQPQLAANELFISGFVLGRPGTGITTYLLTSSGNVWVLGTNDRGLAYGNNTAMAAARQLTRLPAIST